MKTRFSSFVLFTLGYSNCTGLVCMLRGVTASQQKANIATCWREYFKIALQVRNVNKDCSNYLFNYSSLVVIKAQHGIVSEWSAQPGYCQSQRGPPECWTVGRVLLTANEDPVAASSCWFVIRKKTLVMYIIITSHTQPLKEPNGGEENSQTRNSIWFALPAIIRTRTVMKIYE